MVECLFTIDYEIYGNGSGSLHELVYEPTRNLQIIFNRAGVKFVNFVEVCEFEQIERQGTSPALQDIRRQIRELHERGHEIGLHIHPQWTNARYLNDSWALDYSEYNLCTLGSERISYVVDHAIAWLRDVLGDPAFSPLSFRAGNWLIQPTRDVAQVLTSRGLKIDSSVFKGGLQHMHQLDYRIARRNGYFWRFQDDVNVPDPLGGLLELPIHTEMVPFWRMITMKRMGLQKKGMATTNHSTANRLKRFRDYLRPSYPLKFDFCRMTLSELTSMVEKVLRADELSRSVLKPLVAIGHTKDLTDLATIEAFLFWLKERDIPISTFASVIPKCLSAL